MYAVRAGDAGPKSPNAPHALDPRALPVTPVECIVRVYVLRAFDLQAADPNGLSDPYLQVKVAHQKLDNRPEYIPRTLNPVFGKYACQVCILQYASIFHMVSIYT